MRLKRKGVLAFQNAGTPFLFNPKSGISDQHHIGKDCHAGQNTVSFLLLHSLFSKHQLGPWHELRLELIAQLFFFEKFLFFLRRIF